MEDSKTRKIKVIERVGIFIGTLLLLLLICRFAVFFMPFLVAGVIALIIEPIIKFGMNKLKLSRRASSFVVIIITISLLGLTVAWGASTLISELLKLSSNLTPAIESATKFVDEMTNKVSSEYLEIPDQVAEMIENSITDFIGTLGKYLSEQISLLLKMLLSLPAVVINIIITILALIFFTRDRIYVIDLLEYHLPKMWIEKGLKVIAEIASSIGGYFKVYLKLILITFVELFLAFNIYNLLGYEVKYPFALAMLISIIDILPILGVGTIINPWAVWMIIIGEYGYGIALFITYVIIFIIRQFLEPKLVSKQFGIHPIITLMAMYAGYRILGLFGLILGPITLMALKCIFARQIDKGLFKDLFDEK